MARISKRQAQEGTKYIEDRRGGTSFGRGGMTTGSSSRGRTAAGGGIGALIIAVIGILFGLDLGGGGETTSADGSAGSGGGSFEVTEPFDSGTASNSPAGGSEVISCNNNIDACLGGYMDDTQDVWSAIFDNSALTYQFTTLVLYTGETPTDGCGIGRSQAGPFYCPAPSDQKVYIDPAAMAALQRDLGAAGDFAAAYIVAHEVGHHIQSITGTSDDVARLKQQNPNNQNEISVLQELQADCYAGVWGYYANQRSSTTEGLVLDPGDLDEAIQAAEAVGDDSIQSRSGYVDPHTFTHGTAAQRAKWFNVGFNAGNPGECDTFAKGA